MPWDETTGIDAIDNDLMRRGLPPAVIGAILKALGGAGTASATASAQPVPRFTMGATQPQSQPSSVRPEIQTGAFPSPPAPRFTGLQKQSLPPSLEALKQKPGNLLINAAAPRFTVEPSTGSRYDGAVAWNQADRNWLASAKFQEQAERNGEMPDSTTNTPVVRFTDAQSPAMEGEYRDLLKSEPTRGEFPAQPMSIWKKLAGVLLSAAAGASGDTQAARGTAERFFTAPERRANEQFTHAHEDWEQKASNLSQAMKFRHEDMEDRKIQSEIDARNRPKAEKQESLDREAYDFYVSQGMTPAAARQRVLQDAQDVKPGRQTHTSPFEAFAYGDANEKKAAQDFLDLEKRLGTRYRNPTEFEEKYRLYQHNPDAYRAMFGDKSKTTPDTATATRMLNYFDKRRREVNGDFTLDDEQKKQQLDEIENLERPFMDVVQPGPDPNASSADRVNVISPDGRRGHIPRSQLDAAKKKGYREIQ